MITAVESSRNRKISPVRPTFVPIWAKTSRRPRHTACNVSTPSSSAVCMRKLCAHFGSGRKNIDECIIHYRPRHQTITRLDLVPVRTTMSYYGPAGSGGGGGGGRSGRSRGMQPPHHHGGGRSRGPPSHSRGRWGGGGNMRNRGGNAGRRRNQGPPQVSAKKLLKQQGPCARSPTPSQ